MDKPAYGAHLGMVKCTGDSYCNAVQLLNVEPVRGKSGKKNRAHDLCPSQVGTNREQKCHQGDVSNWQAMKGEQIPTLTPGQISSHFLGVLSKLIP